MKRKVYFIILSLLVISLPINIFGIFGAKVSLQYETNNPGDCVSTFSGINLCDSIIRMEVLLAVAVILIYFLLYFKNKILKTKAA